MANPVKQLWNRLIGYKLGGGFLSEMAVPPGWTFAKYLEVYGDVGWLFGAVSLIASSVAEVEWQLYQKKPDGSRDEVHSHALLDMLDYVNPFQTRYQFIELLVMYRKLVGEGWIVLNFNRLNMPVELWLASPQYMAVIPSKEAFISHYEYKKAGSSVRLEIPEVISVISQNPANPYRGISPAQSIAVDLDAERYASRYTQRLFFNDARPGMLIEFPESAGIPQKEQRQEIREEWEERHRGWRNAHKTGFLWGGAKANSVTMTNREMDFWRLRKNSREIILGSYHIPASLMGLSDVGSRARAEADEYIFAKRVVKPELTIIRESLNEQLCPLFGDGLELDFDDPIPENVELSLTQSRDDFKAGIITREEAREVRGRNPEADKGETYLTPMNVLPETASFGLTKSGDIPESQKEAKWQVYKAQTESMERIFIRTFRKVWKIQEEEVLANIDAGGLDPDSASFDEAHSVEIFNEAFHPVIEDIFEVFFHDAIEEVQGKMSPPGETRQGVLDDNANTWIASRSLSLAKMVNGTTKEELRKQLVAGFQEGESMDQIKRRIKHFYEGSFKNRARMVARTEVIAASNEGALKGYESEGVEKAQYYAALDERTCEECMGLHGGIYAVDDAHGLIPVHPNCRCTYLPIA